MSQLSDWKRAHMYVRTYYTCTYSCTYTYLPVRTRVLIMLCHNFLIGKYQWYSSTYSSTMVCTNGTKNGTYSSTYTRVRTCTNGNVMSQGTHTQYPCVTSGMVHTDTIHGTSHVPNGTRTKKMVHVYRPLASYRG